MKRIVRILLALLFAYWGQRVFAQASPLLDAVILYTVGILFFLAAPTYPEDSLDSGPRDRFTKGNLALIGVGVLLVLYAARLFRRDISSNEGLVIWLQGLVAFVLGFWFAGRRSAKRRGEAAEEKRRTLPRPSSTTVVLVIIVLVALFMRLYQLDDMPPGFYLDETDFGLEGVRLLESGKFRPYTRATTGHPTVFFYQLGLAFELLKREVLALRWLMVAYGVLSIPAFYLLARVLFGTRAALLGSALLAVSRWHIAYSRIAFEGVPADLFGILGAFFLIRGLRSRKALDFVWGGMAIGFGLHTYLAFRIFPMVIVVYWAHRYLFEREAIRSNLGRLFVYVLAAFMTFAPLGAYFLKFPADFTARASQASVSLDIEREGSYEPLRQNIRKSLLMFNYRGDPRPRHNLPNEPMLDLGTAMLFLLGVGYSFRYWKQSRFFLLLVWLLLSLLPGILSLADSNPHSLRTIISLPAVFLLAAVAADRVWETVAQGLQGRALLYRVGLAVILLVLIGRANYVTYFHKQARSESVYYDFDPIQTAVGKQVKAMGHTHRLYVSRYFTNHADVKFIPYGVPYYDFDLNAHLPIREPVDQDVLFILERNHAPFVTRLQQLYPRGIYREVDDRYGKLMYYTFLVPTQEVAAIQGLQGSYYASAEPEGDPTFQRRDATISFDWSTAGLAFISGPGEPFSATWDGSLYVPRFGNYVFILDTDGSAQLWLDEELVVESSGGRTQGAIRLPAGFHAVALNASGQRASGRLSLNWIPVGGSGEQTVPQTALYTAHLARQGLLGRYYRGTNWSGVPVSIQLDSFIAPNDVIPSPFSIQWEGRIYAPTTGNYAFATNSDDGSLLYIDGQLVVDNGGHHGDRYVEGRINLEEGFHDITLRYFQDGGGRKIEVWWVSPGRGKELVPAKFLSPPSERLPEPPTFLVPPQVVQIPEDVPIPEVGPIGQVRYLSTWGGQGAAPGQFQEPRGIAVDRQRGQVYVVDTGNKRVQVFGLDGSFIAVWDRGDEPFEEPFDIVVDSRGDVFVLDAVTQIIQRFGPSGDLRGAMGRDLALYHPRGLAIDAEDNLYVADTGGNRILKITPSGQQLAQIGDQGLGPGQVNQPTDVAVDASGRMYVVDTYNQRVQVLDPAGRYLREWPIGGANTFDSPHAQLGPGGQLFITDPEAHLVIAYDGAGRALAEWGGFGEEAGRFHKPLNLAFDGVGQIYVVDTYNHRVQVFQQSGS